MLLILRFMFTFSLLKKFTKEKLYGALRHPILFVIQYYKRKVSFFFFFLNQLLLQSILGPLRDAATLQVKSNAPSSEPFVKH